MSKKLQKDDYRDKVGQLFTEAEKHDSWGQILEAEDKYTKYKFDQLINFNRLLKLLGNYTELLYDISSDDHVVFNNIIFIHSI